MRFTSAFLALGVGLVSTAAGKAAMTESALPAPTVSQPAVVSTAAQPAAQPGGRAVDGTAITESTEAGRQVVVPTADRPAYFVIQSGGRHDFGSAIAEKKAASSENFDQQVAGSLARSHYLPGDASHQPSLLIVYNWGLHGVSSENFDDPGYRNLLDRAALVGGNGFANELKKVLQQSQLAADATPTGRWGAQMPGMRSVSAASLFQASNPFERFRKRDQKTEDLLVQLSNDCYYVVISAFDYATVGQNKRQLLWRTKLTTAAPGTSLAAAVPSLIANGAGYFGRGMNEAEFFSTR